MKQIILAIFLFHSISAMPQSAGLQKWKSYDGTNFSYVGELKDGQINGVGLYTRDGYAPLFGYFESSYNCIQGVRFDKDGQITISNFNVEETNGLTIFKGSNNSLSLANMRKNKKDGLQESISQDGTMELSNYYSGSLRDRQLKFAGDRSHIMVIDIEWGWGIGGRWNGLKYDIKQKRLISGIWKSAIKGINEYELAESKQVPISSFLKRRSFQASENDKQLIISESAAADGGRINDTCIVVDKTTGECSFGFYENGQLRYGLINFNNGVKAIGSRANNMWNGYCLLLNTDSYLYAGMFVNDQMHGKGVLVKFPGNDIYIGEFKNNKVEGKGAMYSQKQIFVGTFTDGTLDGYGKTIFEDGQQIEGYYSNGVIKKIKTKNGDEIFVSPAKFDDAIDFLLKDWESNFSTIKFNSVFDPGVKSATWSADAIDCIYQMPVYGYARWILPNQKGKDGKARNEFVFAVSESTIKSKDMLETVYNDIFSKLKFCELTNLSAGKKLKLVPPVNGKLPANLNFKKFECLFTVPAYPGKKADPVIRLMVENLNGEYYITVTVKSK